MTAIRLRLPLALKKKGVVRKSKRRTPIIVLKLPLQRFIELSFSTNSWTIKVQIKIIGPVKYWSILTYSEKIIFNIKWEIRVIIIYNECSLLTHHTRGKISKMDSLLEARCVSIAYSHGHNPKKLIKIADNSDTAV